MLFRLDDLQEPAGAVPLGERALRAGQRVAAVLSGGTVDTPVPAEVLAGGTPSA